MKEFADDSSKRDEIKIDLPLWQKTLWEKDKLLVTSNFSFTHNVFKSRLQQIGQIIPFPYNFVRITRHPDNRGPDKRGFTVHLMGLECKQYEVNLKVLFLDEAKVQLQYNKSFLKV